jgi:hypothetical protein
MQPDNFPPALPSLASESRLTINADLLLKEVQRNQRFFNTTILWRDVREVGIALVLVPCWIYSGAHFSLPWTWYLIVPVLLWIAGYMLADRLRHQRNPPEPGEPLAQRLENSLAQVNQQIRLLRTVLWWCLAPLAVAMMAFIGQVAWQSWSGDWPIAIALTVVVALLATILASVYWLNQMAVRTELEPRRKELETLLASLKDDGEKGTATSC